LRHIDFIRWRNAIADLETGMSDYQRIAQAIQYLRQHKDSQPTLGEVAEQVHLSPAHFQRLFSRWAGVSPKRYLQYLTLADAKDRLRIDQNASASKDLLGTSLSLGLSGSSRLYDHFVTLEAVTPGEFKSGGTGVRFFTGICPSPYGDIWVAQSARGIHQMRFVDAENAATLEAGLRADWPAAEIQRNHTEIENTIKQLFDSPVSDKPLSLWVKGSNFQIQVWRALLEIPSGQLSSYGALGKQLHMPKASRAIGTAVGANPVALMIPCHRVIRQDGSLSGYRWGTERKQAILCREWAREAVDV
jgi:AraC family transcriptional regulator of adaptative response/methylated-DNA-[protein]-cysteine methyltransferase